MRVESTEVPGVDEPDEGWVTATPLIDSEVVEVVLCRFTGYKVPVDDTCSTLLEGGHPDVECRAVYLQADNLPFITSGGMGFDDAQDEIRQPWRGGEWTGVHG